MPSRFWLKLAAIATAVALILAAVQAWRADHHDRAQLAAELAATKQLLTQADARQRDRDAQLAQTLAALTEQKRAAATPAQILSELQKSIGLPAPIALLSNGPAPVGARFSASPLTSPTATVGDASKTGTNLPPRLGSTQAVSTSGKSPSAQAVIPAADLKPLYDFTLDCQACQAKLSVAQADLADEKVKAAALTKERDDAVRIAKGGSAWRRAARAAKWFLLGAAAGAIAAKGAH